MHRVDWRRQIPLGCLHIITEVDAVQIVVIWVIRPLSAKSLGLQRRRDEGRRSLSLPTTRICPLSLLIAHALVFVVLSRARTTLKFVYARQYEDISHRRATRGRGSLRTVKSAVSPCACHRVTSKLRAVCMSIRCTTQTTCRSFFLSRRVVRHQHSCTAVTHDDSPQDGIKQPPPMPQTISKLTQ